MKHFYFFIILTFMSCSAPDDHSSEFVNIDIPQTISGDWYERGKDSIRIIAHGGASAYEPFNSIPSFIKAFELKADGIELDLMNSKDDSLMVFHDLNTKRYTGVDYNVVDTKSIVLRGLDIGNGERMPFLSEVFKVLPPGKKIYLEIKWYQDSESRNNNGLIDKLIKQIDKSGRIKDCVVVCFSLDYLIKIKLKKPELNLFWNNYDVPSCKTAAEKLSKYNFQGCNIFASIINPELSDSLVKSKKFLFAWTVNDASVAAELCEKYKITGIFTDKPDVIRHSVAKFMK